MAEAPEFLTNADRIANRDEMTRRLTEATLQRAKADLLAACEAQGVPAGPINDLAEVFADPAGHRTRPPDRDRWRAGRAPALPVFRRRGGTPSSGPETGRHGR
jgi:crotonobetainyl-CoA:carnitine CoA-transferase CaiB-like acyl-CoA transferase